MEPAIVLLHGLPGAGKTTVSRLIAEASSDFLFVDLGSHPEFRDRPMYEICEEEYLAKGDGKSLITEGVLGGKSGRDRFVSKLIEGTAETEHPLVGGLIVFLDEGDLEVLAGRRNRKVEYYAEMRAEIEEGSEDFDYVHYRPRPDEQGHPEVRAERLLEIIRERLRAR
jgi:hypothetical protein